MEKQRGGIRLISTVPNHVNAIMCRGKSGTNSLNILLENANLINDGSLFLRVRPPQHEDDSVKVTIDPGDDCVGEHLPSLVLVGVGLVGTHRQHGIQ